MFAKKRTGWIGIDIGTSTVKLVQLVRSRNRVRFAGSAIVPRRDAWPITDLPENKPFSSADEILAATSLDSGFRGKRAAATLPMTVCDVHAFPCPSSQSPEQDRYIRQAIELATQRSAANLQYDLWDTESDPKSTGPPKSNVLSVARPWTDQLCDDVAQSGWCCQTIDGLPLALARAVAMVEEEKPSPPIAAIDWGFGRATFCVVVEGRPVYVRCLKECGLRLLLERLTNSLNVTEEEAQRLLQQYGVKGSNDKESQAIGELIVESISPQLAQLEEEIKRTISHLQGQRRTIIPKKLYLFGGGATINGIDDYLAQQIELKVKTWRFGTEGVGNAAQPSLPSCLFGPAIALSALAWESP